MFVSLKCIIIEKSTMERITKSTLNVLGIRAFSKYMYSAEDILKIVNYKLTFNKAMTEATVYTDGLQFSDYDQKTYFPKTEAIFAISQAASTFAHYKELDSTGKTFRDFKTLTKGRSPFLLSSKMLFYKPFYDPLISKNPLIVKVTGGYVGNTTVGYTTTKYTNTEKLLCKNETIIYIIDKKTGRPAAHPEWWKRKHNTKTRETTTSHFRRIQKITPPSDVLRYTVSVTGSDIDLNLHTCWLSYIRFAEDALYHFAKRNVFENQVNAVVEKGMLESIELLYTGETFEGDCLDVLVWKSDTDDVIYTQILKYNNPVFQGRFQYFDLNDKSSKENMFQSKL